MMERIGKSKGGGSVEYRKLAGVLFDNELHRNGIDSITADLIADSFNNSRIFHGNYDKVHSGFSFPNLRALDIFGFLVLVFLIADLATLPFHLVEVVE